MDQHRAFAASIFQNSTQVTFLTADYHALSSALYVQATESSSNAGEMQNSVLVEMLSRMGDLDHYQDHQAACIGGTGHMIELASNGIQHVSPVACYVHIM